MGGAITQRVQALRIAATALLIASLWTSTAFADEKNASPGAQPAPGSTPSPATGQKQAAPKEGTRDATEAAAKAAEDAYNKYQEVCANGTDAEKEAAKSDWEKKYSELTTAIQREALNTKEGREASDNYRHYWKAYAQLEKNPNSNASDIEKAKSDLDKAVNKLVEVSDKAGKKIWDEIHAKFTVDGPEKCQPPEEKKKKKKDKNKTSGPLDFFGNVTIGVGVGGGDSEYHGDHHGGNRHTDKQSQPSVQNCCTHQGQSVQCPSGLPAGSKSVKYVEGGTMWATPTGEQKFVPQTSFPACK